MKKLERRLPVVQRAITAAEDELKKVEEDNKNHDPALCGFPKEFQFRCRLLNQWCNDDSVVKV